MELFTYSLSKRDLHKSKRFMRSSANFLSFAFTLVEMLMALLIVSVILSASIPVITSRTKAAQQNYSKYSPMPIGAIIMWKADGALPDSTWLEANGQAVPNGIEYEECRRVYGSRLPDLRGADNEFYDNLNKYLSKDMKDYLQSAIKPIPKDLIGIWGTTSAIPEGWSEATEYRGVFLRGYGSVSHTQNNGSTIGSTATTHSSGAIGALQGDAVRNMQGNLIINDYYRSYTLASSSQNGVFKYIAVSKKNLAGGTGYNLGLQTLTFDASFVVPVANENRPINKAVKFIKYVNSPSMPDMPEAPQYARRFRYIVKVKN